MLIRVEMRALCALVAEAGSGVATDSEVRQCLERSQLLAAA
jgi:hypothetical protein